MPVSTPSSASAHPIRTLREQITTLEGAIVLCLAQSKAKAVHQLRTTTRRIEGQFAMLELIPGVPKHDKPARKARRILKRLRRAAGGGRGTHIPGGSFLSVCPQ